MSETTQDSPDEQVQASAPDRQMSLAPGDDVDASDLCPTRIFPADPSALSREALEAHYRAMRRSHVFLARSRGQLRRRSRESNDKRQDLLDMIRYYQEQFSAIGKERVEEFQLARELQEKLKAFEKNQQALNQLLDELENAKEKTGFWSVFTITQLLERMRQLLRGGRPGQ